MSEPPCNVAAMGRLRIDSNGWEGRTAAIMSVPSFFHVAQHVGVGASESKQRHCGSPARPKSGGETKAATGGRGRSVGRLGLLAVNEQASVVGPLSSER